MNTLNLHKGHLKLEAATIWGAHECRISPQWKEFLCMKQSRETHQHSQENRILLNYDFTATVFVKQDACQE